MRSSPSRVLNLSLGFFRSVKELTGYLSLLGILCTYRHRIFKDFRYSALGMADLILPPNRSSHWSALSIDKAL